MPLLEQVLEKNPKLVKIVFKHFPLKKHKAALLAAAATLIANDAGKFWEFHSLLVDHFRQLSEDKILEISEELGFDRAAFKNQIQSTVVLKRIQKDITDSQKAGVQGIPKVFVNGRSLKKRSLEGFQSMIDEEIKKR